VPGESPANDKFNLRIERMVRSIDNLGMLWRSRRRGFCRR